MVGTALKWPPEQPTLPGDGIRLRPWRSSDAESVYRACQDEAIQRFTRVPVPYRMEHAVGFVGDFARQQWEAGSGCAFAVVDDADQVLASCGAPSVKPEAGWADVGYWVAPEARGHGFATKAVRVLTGWLIESVGLRTVVLEIEESNAASLTVSQAAGFVRKPGVHWEEHRGTTRPFTLWRFE